MYLKNGNTFRVTDQAELDLHNELPVGTYVVKLNELKQEYYLEAIDNFTLPKKLYGKTNRYSERILSTFRDREHCTGVLLSGEKGSGKTLLTKQVALSAQATGIPTLIVNNAFCGDNFNGFLQTIDHPVVVIFDEFEKVYTRNAQQHVLTLLDGVYSSKKLFLFTCNNKYAIDEFLKNRPGRIFYMLEFHGIEEDFIREYCEDNLVNKSYINEICKIRAVFSDFNFDMLKAVVEEMNRYNESPKEVLEMLNVTSDFNESVLYNVKLVVNGRPIPEDKLYYSKTWEGNPLNQEIEVRYYTGTDDDDDDTEEVSFTIGDLFHIESATKTFTFRKGNDQVELSPRVKQSFNYHML